MKKQIIPFLLLSVAYAAEVKAPNPILRYQITGEGLWWQANESNLEYVLKYLNTGSSATQRNQGSYHNPHFGWDGGFRVGFAYLTPQDDWRLNLQWTRFYTSAKSSVSANSDERIDPIDSLFDNTDVFNQATSHFRIHIDYIDLSLEKCLLAARTLKIIPFFGLRTQWIHQRNKVAYLGNYNPSYLNSNAYTSFHNDNWGLGPRLGVNTAWEICRCWSLIADAAVSLLYGFFDLKASYTDNIGDQHVNVHTKESYRITRADTDLLIGIHWKHDFETWNLAFQASWEHHIFFDQWQWGQRIPPDANASLATSGATLSAMIGF